MTCMTWNDMNMNQAVVLSHMPCGKIENVFITSADSSAVTNPYVDARAQRQCTSQESAIAIEFQRTCCQIQER